MRIAHISDLHVARPPAAPEFNLKRLLGYVNHRWFRGRRHSETVAAAAIGKLLDNPPDLVLLTGDLTQHGLDAEFAGARKLLAPLARIGVPVLTLAGNHDFYGSGEPESLRGLARDLAAGLEPDASGLFRFPGVELLALNQGVRTPPFMSYGRIDPAQLSRAGAAWAEPPRGVMRLACGHFPVIDAAGNPLSRFRGLRGAAEVVRFCRERQVAGYFCGHNHKRFVASMSGGCVQYAAPSLSLRKEAKEEWISVYRCGPELANPVDEGRQ